LIEDPHVPKLGIRTRGTDDTEIDLRRRPSRPPSRSRRKTGGAASAVLLIVFGTGTLGALPVAHVNVQGHVASLAAESLSDPAAGTDLGSQVLGDLGVDSGAALVADQTTYEQREAQFTTALPDQRAQIAIRTAMAQIGLPYIWGGDGPTNGDAGFDCSGLTTFSYAAAGVSLPRTAHTQYYDGPHVPQGAPLQPGDLVFYGTPAKVHHVGLYLGDGKMVNAPTFGKPVQVAFYRYSGDDYLGATRPAANGQTTSGLLPYAPAEPSTGTPETFPAPVAPAPTTEPNATAPQPSEAVSAAEATAEATTAAAVTAVTVTVTPTTLTAPTTTPSSVVTTTPSTKTSTSAKPSTSTTTPSTTTQPVVAEPSSEPAKPSESTSASVSVPAGEPSEIVTTTVPLPS
jgi:cell wall-associated NlpC family hydrolase